MHQPLNGVKMVEVAQYTFTPAAGAVLAEWGADVIKVEHAVTGDAQRGLRLGARSAPPSVRSTPLWSTPTAGSAASAWLSTPPGATRS
jgi:crotonobetainyl-CoA:carnitine CoA-transferase CaiB-like acyl-CoA transferase